MSRALRYLLLRSARHRTAAQVRRITQPRYAVAGVLGLAYLASFMARPPRAELASAPVAETALLAGSIGLAGWMFWMWTFGRSSRLLAFTRAEAAFLLAGPVGRTRLLGYRLARAQLAIIGNAALWALFFGWSGGGYAAWRAFPAAWLLLTTLQLHHLGASIARARPEGTRNARWRVEAAALVVACVVLLLAVTDVWPIVRQGWSGGLDPFLASLRDASVQPVILLLLAPFQVAVAPLAAATPREFAGALPSAVVLLALHVLWIVAVRERYRRLAAEAPAGSAAQNRQLVWSQPLVRLGPRGPALLALTWKNVAAVLRWRRVGVLAAGALALALAAILAGMTVAPVVPQGVAAVSGVWAFAFALLGPQWVRNDLRTDLLYLDYVRSWPLRGGAIVAAEVLASTIVLTASQLTLVAVAVAAAYGSDAAAELPPEALVAVAAAVAALPLLNWLHLLVHNSLAVLYPGWVPLGPQPRTGVEGLGQQAIVLVAGIGGLLILLLPAFVLASIAWNAFDGTGTSPAGAVAATAVVGVIAALASSALTVRWVGRRLELVEPGDLDAAAQARG